MDNVKTGKLIYRLRKEKGLTQLELAERMHISDKTVSKWERGLGCPELGLLKDLADIFNVDMEKLLSGELEESEILGGNMKKMKFYVCPHCGNVFTAMNEAGITCCGKKLMPLEAQKEEGEHSVTVEEIENEFYITSLHPMQREHYIAFVALLSSDSLMLRKQYPQWDFEARLPIFAHGRLFWYCSEHGLFFKDL